MGSCQNTRRLLAKGSKTELTVDYTLAFVSPVNRFIRSFIERGAEAGLSKNFAQVIEVGPTCSRRRKQALHAIQSHTGLLCSDIYAYVYGGYAATHRMCLRHVVEEMRGSFPMETQANHAGLLTVTVLPFAGPKAAVDCGRRGPSPPCRLAAGHISALARCTVSCIWSASLQGPHVLTISSDMCSFASRYHAMHHVSELARSLTWYSHDAGCAEPDGWGPARWGATAPVGWPAGLGAGHAYGGARCYAAQMAAIR